MECTRNDIVWSLRLKPKRTLQFLSWPLGICFGGPGLPCKTVSAQVMWVDEYGCSGWQLQLGSQVAASIHTRHEWKCLCMVLDPSHSVTSSLQAFPVEGPGMLGHRQATSAVRFLDLWPPSAVSIIKWLLLYPTKFGLLYDVAIVIGKRLSPYCRKAL